MFAMGNPGFAFDWFQAATRAHMFLSQTMPDEMLDELVSPDPVHRDDDLLEAA